MWEDGDTEYNKWFPHNRPQLMRHDPDSFAVLHQYWSIGPSLTTHTPVFSDVEGETEGAVRSVFQDLVDALVSVQELQETAGLEAQVGDRAGGRVLERYFAGQRVASFAAVPSFCSSARK